MSDDPSASESNPRSPPLRLDHFIKLAALLDTGGQAKLMIQNGEIKVNGQVETRRRRKLTVGDVVEFGGQRFPVTMPSPVDPPAQHHAE